MPPHAAANVAAANGKAKRKKKGKSKRGDTLITRFASDPKLQKYSTLDCPRTLKELEALYGTLTNGPDEKRCLEDIKTDDIDVLQLHVNACGELMNKKWKFEKKEANRFHVTCTTCKEGCVRFGRKTGKNSYLSLQCKSIALPRMSIITRPGRKKRHKRIPSATEHIAKRMRVLTRARSTRARKRNSKFNDYVSL